MMIKILRNENLQLYNLFGSMSLREKLKNKRQKSEQFQKQMEKAQANYSTLSQRVYYSGVNPSDCTFIVQFNGKNRLDASIFFIDGEQQQYKVRTLDKLSLYLIAKIPKPKSHYIIVYFNNPEYSNTFSDFKTVFQILPFEYFYHLDKLILVKPTFMSKASRYFVFGTIPKFINEHTQYADNIEQLTELLVLDRKQIMKYAPQGYEPLQKYPKYGQKPTNNNHMKNQQRNRNQTQPIITNAFKQSKNRIKFEIDQYDKTENGLPQIFQLLIYCFQAHPDWIEIQGIFRKSANVDEQAEALDNIARKHYKCIQQIDNPHIIANLIKKFLGNLLTPIIPFQMFHQIMDQTQITPQYLKNKMKKLGSINITKLLCLMFLFQFLLSTIVPISNKNKMTADNLAICFAPCIMWAKERSMKDIGYATKSVQVVSVMLKNFEQVFGSRQDQQKLYRESYYYHKSKSLQKVLSISSQQEVQKKNRQNSQLVIQKTQSRQQNPDQFIEDDQFEQRTINVSKIKHKGIFSSRLNSKTSQMKYQQDKYKF